MPFIEKGKPVFIDKPIIGSVKDAKRYKQLIDNGAKIIGSSSARHAQEIRDFLAIPISERGEVVNVFGTCGVDEFNYSIHIVEIFSEIAGCNAVECKYNGTAQREDGTKCENYTIRFENGILATYATVINGWRPFQVTIMTTKGTYIFEIDVDKIYGALLREIYKYLSGKEHNLASCDTLINCSYIMMCGKKSRDEKKGAWVKLAELTDEDKFDGYEFEDTYAKNASNIYKD